jgi:aspartyl-tRNA(Asn)/glutamyl-tRNA(Gln) amidotransferase subunit B
MRKILKPIIGFEVHVEQSTISKMFCGCSAKHFHVKPNSHVCPVCLGLPGALPVPNRQAIENTIKLGLTLNCKINHHSKFDRKHYFYPDLSKGYQISQYDLPFCYDGHLTLDSGKKIRIKRIHLEEDTGKLVHQKVGDKKVSLVDFNRSGVPLIELVTEPDFESSGQATEFLKKIHHLVRVLKISNADMEKGSMRLEANISVGDPNNLPNYKVEIKNVNSFKFISQAIDYEIDRQTKLFKTGKTPIQETRGWNRILKRTFNQRLKEGEADYRYFPEPDIPPINISDTLIGKIKACIPKLPEQLISELLALGIDKKYVKLIIKSKKLLSIIKEFEKNREVNINKMANFLINKKITAKTYKEIFFQYKEYTKVGISDAETILNLTNQVLEKNPKAFSDYSKNPKSIGFLVGQVMALSQGKANPQAVHKALLEKLKVSQ